MHREKLVGIWFVFRIWKFEVTYVNCICVTCILFVGLVENFKIAVRMYKSGRAGYTCYQQDCIM